MNSNADNLPDPEHLKKLVARYDRSGPRYTSYPTVPVWSEEFTGRDYLGAVRSAAGRAEEPLSLYLHIPFCRKRCWYCGCNTTVGCTVGDIDRYLENIAREMALVENHLNGRKRVSQLHWGGGTPTFLNAGQTENTFRLFADRFEILPDAEISIELDPRITTPERLDLLRRLGFNRLSFGVQDFDPAVQEAIGRNQEEKPTVELYHHAREAGFKRINFDLIYGLPRQNPESFRATLEKTTALRPDRIALYSFAHLPTVMIHQKQIDPGSLPSPETKFSLFYAALKHFSGAGYCQIGMDHFVRPDDELAGAAATGKLRRNFMGYTVDSAVDWIGIGMSAISYIDRCFAQNLSRIESYGKAIEQDGPATYRGLALNDEDLIRQRIISDLMCNFTVAMDDLEEIFKVDFKTKFADEIRGLKPFIDDGLASIDDSHLKVTGAGRIFIRNIAMLFDAYLTGDKAKRPKAKFSRTI